MTFLLDTNVLSEVTRPKPDSAVIRFLHERDEDRMAVSAVTIAEIRRGIALLPQGRRRRVLANWLEGDLVERFGPRILPIDVRVALVWGDLMGRARTAGLALHVMDGFLAATALTYGLVLVTRNEKDFADTGVSLFNPWSGAPPPDPAGTRG